MRVLLVEDDDAIAGPLGEGLAGQGYDVERVADGASALRAADYDLVLLDLGLPDMDGFEVCRRLRSASDVPIIVVSARGEEYDRVIGLELGADDYLVKPFGFRELVARIRAVSRRVTQPVLDEPVPPATTDRSPGNGFGAGYGVPPPGGPTVRFGDVEIDSRARKVLVGGTEVDVTRKEFDLLALLAADPGALRTRTEILEEVWDPHWYGPTKTLDVHVASLRKKLGDSTLIETVRGVGYRLRTE